MMQVVGRPTPRVEGVQKVTGKAKYSADLKLPGTLWGRALRSSVPHARIVRIDTSRAQQVPGVHVWHDKIRGCQGEVSVHVWRGDRTPTNTEHPIASGFDDKFVMSGLAGFQGDNVFNAAITPVSTSDPLKRCTI